MTQSEEAMCDEVLRIALQICIDGSDWGTISATFAALARFDFIDLRLCFSAKHGLAASA